MKPKASLRLLLGSSCLALLSAPALQAVTYYWDNNGDTAGFGTAAGIWAAPTTGDATQGWSTSNTGELLPVDVTTTTADTVNFGTGTAANGLAAGSITVSGTVQTGNVTFGSQSGAITLSGGILTLSGGRTITSNNTGNIISSELALTGATTFSIGTFSTATTRQLTLGVLSGTGGATFQYVGGGNATGLFLLNGANTYSGTTLISSTLTNANTEVRLGVDNALPTTTLLTIGGAAGAGSAPGRKTQLNLNGHNQTLAGIATTGGGSLRTQNILSSSAATLTIDGTSSNTFAGLIGNGGTNISIVKAGSGIQTFSGANTYVGLTTVNGGGLRIQHASGLGNTAAGTVVNGTGTAGSANARLELAGGVTVSGESLTISGVGNFFGALASTSGNNVWAGGVTIGAAGTRIGAVAGASLEVSGNIDSGANPHGLIIRTTDLTGSVILSGANTYLGNTQVLIGKLQLAGGDDRLPVGTNLFLSSGGTNPDAEFDLNGRNQEVAGLSLGGSAVATQNSVNNSSGTLSTLTVNTAAASIYAGKLDGNLALAKTGTNTLTLTGTNNTYSGATNVDQGTLIVDGNISTSILTTVASTATISGSGTVGALTIQSGGTVAPGNSPDRYTQIHR